MKAMGVPLASRGLVQVSMNLTNFEVTPVASALAAVRAEAEQLGVTVAGTEIVGLAPRKALAGLENIDPRRVLEDRLG